MAVRTLPIDAHARSWSGVFGRVEAAVLAAGHVDHGDLVAPSAREAVGEGFDVPVYEDYEAMLDAHGDAVDAVNVVTPHTLHYEHAAACFERDLHVFIEKPLTTDLDDAVALCEQADRRDLVLQVGYQRHFDPVFQEIRRVVADGRIGQVHAATCYLGQE